MAPPPYNSTQYYLAVWKGMVDTLLGWSEEQVVTWAQQGAMWAALDDPGHIIFHESPMYWAKHLLIPGSLHARLPHDQLLRLERDLWAVFTEEAKDWHADPEAIDWLPYKKKVDWLLAQYARSLPHQGEVSLYD